MSFDYYTAKTGDLLVQKKAKDEVGLKYYWSNGGDMTNHGINFSTTVRAINLRDWKLDVGATIGHYKNKITSLPEGQILTDICGGQVLTAVGNPVGVFYGYKADGVYASVADAQAANLSIRNADGSLTPFEAGDMRFRDLDGNNIINEKDREIIGDPNPDIFGNFNLRLSWKNFTLGTVFTYSVGNDAYNALRAARGRRRYLQPDHRDAQPLGGQRPGYRRAPRRLRGPDGQRSLLQPLDRGCELPEMEIAVG